MVGSKNRGKDLIEKRTDPVFEKIVAHFSMDAQAHAVIVNGSRANPQAVIDRFSDYDVRILVDDYTVYRDDLSWLNAFGNIAIKQVNPSKGARLFYNESYDVCFVLVLFTNDVRIDFSFSNVNDYDYKTADSLSVVLLDKTGMLQSLNAPTERDYYLQAPEVETFAFVENDFFWCLTNVAKGLARDELAYAKSMFDIHVRQALVAMLTWHIHSVHGKAINVGLYGRWLKQFCDEGLWQRFEKTYADANTQSMWGALFIGAELFSDLASAVALHHGFQRDRDAKHNVMAYLERVYTKAL